MYIYIYTYIHIYVYIDIYIYQGGHIYIYIYMVAHRLLIEKSLFSSSDSKESACNARYPSLIPGF